MAEKKKYTSSSRERELTCYPKPRVFMMFEAERKYLLRGKSEHLKSILERYYDGLNASHQRQLLDTYYLQIKNK